ncbi:MAG: hypothetical protein Q7T18_06670 [Sedimentisphaerales bacterium]|nr:hypothetical protein [Sedimentisphaerales bacterium]
MKPKLFCHLAITEMVAIPRICIRPVGLHFDPYIMAIASGIAILGAFFILLLASKAVQADVSHVLVLAIVAIIAMLPTYAIDVYFSWQVSGKLEQEEIRIIARCV